MKNNSPYFSLLIPSFNRPDYLNKTLKSLFQTIFFDFEVIVADDKSPKINDILNVVKEFELRQNFRFYQHKENIGMSENWNFLVQKATGKYVILLGDDDLLFPYSLERIKQNIENNDKSDIYAFGYQVIDGFGNQTYSIRSTKKIFIDINCVRVVKKLFNADILPFALFHPLTMAIRRELGDEIRFNKEAGIGSDFLFLFEAILNEKIIQIIPEVLFSWRKTFTSGASVHENLSSIERNIEARLKILALLRKKEIEQDFLRSYINTSAYYDRFILHPYISHKELWYRDSNNILLNNEEDYRKIKHKLNLYYFTYLRINRMIEKLILLGLYPTYLNIKAYFRRK